MKILFLNPSGLFGGAERSLLDIIASINAAHPDWEISLIAGSNGALIERARALGVATSVVPMPASLERVGDSGAGGPAGSRVGGISMMRSLAGAAVASPGYTRRLAREIEMIAPEVVHTNGFKMHVLGANATRRKRPVVWHIHDYVRARPVMARLMRATASRCAAAIANSNSVRDDVRAACGPRLDVTTVYNAVNLDEFNPAGPVAALDKLAGLPAAPHGTVRVGLVATMGAWKGHDVFLRAMANTPGEAPMRAYVIGDAIYQTGGSQVTVQSLRDRARALGLGDRVGFTGFVDDVAAAMRALDIVVHASTAPEPFGLAIAEAMACGRAVIVSEAGGAAEIVAGTGAALGHRPGDAAGLASQIMRLVKSPGEREALGRAGRHAAERMFARARLAAEIVPIYERVLRTSL